MAERRYAMKSKSGATVWVPESRREAFLAAQKQDAPKLTPEERERRISEIKSLLLKKAGK